MKLGMLILLGSLAVTMAYGQTFADILNPSKETVKNAKINAQEYLESIKDTLEITPKQTKIKRIKLIPCVEVYSALKKNELFGDASEFLTTNNCEGLYRYEHPISNPQRTHYLVTFYFDSTGELLTANSQWILVIR